MSKTFQLHSNPSSTKKIYLDFDGFNGFYHNYNPWNMEGLPGTFSSSEQTRIHQIWQSVSEDFLPFNIDVTTQDPGTNGLRKSNGADQAYGVRVVIDGNGTNVGEGVSVNGSSYYGYSWADAAFTENSDTETYVFPYNHSWPWIADSVSHEVGHTLGLDHDGGGGDGEYWYGHGTPGTATSYYSPIMGWTRTDFPTGVSQWSKGEYSGANNLQDDLLVISSTGNNGTPYRADDHGSTKETATGLTQGVRAEGIIEQRADLDFFTFTLGNQSILHFDINPNITGANLDILAKLYNDQGNLLGQYNPLDLLSASFDTMLPSGIYYLSIDGTGFGNPVTNGYSDYASLGYFSIVFNATVIPEPSCLALLTCGFGGAAIWWRRRRA